MSGHNKWTQIKHQKSAADKKRGAVFSKILGAIAVAAHNEPKPEFNPRLRSLIEKARASNVPQENIDRAIKKIAENKNLEEMVIEAYGPAGIAMIIKCVTDNRNRTVAEIRHLLNENGGKIAESGGVSWAFDGNRPKFPQKTSSDDREKINHLLKIFNERDDVQEVITSIQT